MAPRGLALPEIRQWLRSEGERERESSAIAARAREAAAAVRNRI
jgi:hypothetical protein